MRLQRAGPAKGDALQNTLLTIAVALILALVAALAAPFVVDWNDYRGVVEREASRMTGLPVTVAGKIDVRLLPSPQLTLRDVTVSGVRARVISIELALGSLMRGEWRATDLHVVAPQLETGIDQAGKLRWPGAAASFDPNALSIDRLHVEEGRLVLTDAGSGARRVLDGIWFNGDARSLAGPVRGEGAATLDGEIYPYRLSVSRVSDAGSARVRLNVDPQNRPLTLEADGEVSLAQGTPRFEGQASFSRPVQLVGNRAAGRDKTAVTPPWRASAKVKVTPASVLLEQVEFQYGADDLGAKLTGTADVKFGAEPRIEGVLSARQLDLDRALANADGTRLPAAAALRTLAQAAGGVLPFPFQLGIGIDQVTLGGGTVLAVRGDVASSNDGWTLSDFEFRAPGSSRVQLAGRLTTTPASRAGTPPGVAFKGAAGVESSDLRALVGWLEGRSDLTPGPVRSLKARGDVTLGSDTIAVERLRAELDRETIEGRLVYNVASAARPAKLEAVLRASDIDIDGARSFLAAALAGTAVEAPQDLALTVDLGRATVGGVAVRDLRAKLAGSKNGIDIERLSVGDLGGAAVTAGGRLAFAPQPRGNLSFDLNARDLKGVTTLLSQYAPAAAPVLARFTGRAQLRGTVALDAADNKSGVGKASLEGSVGPVRVTLAAQSTGDLAKPETATLKLDGRLESDDGAALAALTSLDRIASVGREPGRLTFTAEGPLQSDMRVKAQIVARGLDAAAEGTARYANGAVTGALHTTVKEADLRPLFGVPQSVPARFAGDVTLAKDRVTLASASGTVAGANLRGRAAIGLVVPHSIDADIDADDINGAAIVAALTGWPEGERASRGGAQSNLWAWPVDPFARGLAADYRGKVVLRSQRATVTPAWLMRELRATLTLGDAEAKVSDLSGSVAGGRVAGTVSLKRGGEGLRADLQMKLTDADAAMLLPAAARPPVSGRVGLDVTLAGTGLSPNALVGSLAGSGKVTLDNAQLAALDPHAFEAVMRAADRGLPLDAIRVRDFMSKALDGGQLPVRHADGALDVASGQVRLQNLTADADGAVLAVSGNLDLTQGMIDARMVLSGKTDAAGSKPDVFMGLRGPLGAATRTIDVSALSGWLTLRNVDIQAKKLEAIEAAQQKPAAPPEPRPIAPSPEIPPLVKPEPAPPAATHSVVPSAPPLPPAQTIAPAPKPMEQRPRAAPQAPAAQQAPTVQHAPTPQRPAARPPLQLVPQQN